MDNAFTDFVISVRYCQMNINTSLSCLKKCVETALTVFENASSVEIAEICDKRQRDIRTVRSFLLNYKTGDAKLRKMINTICSVYLIEKGSDYQSITNIFEEFIKGVTYFSDQQDQHETKTKIPIYHRLFSCGSENTPFREQFMQCKMSNTASWATISKQIQRCYIERKIYTAIYNQNGLHFPLNGTEELATDKGHLFRLSLTKQDFQTCFPNKDIDVRIEYFPHTIIPSQVTILYISNGNTEIEEIYIKNMSNVAGEIYEQVVECVKRTGDDRWFKLQYFKTRNRWNMCGSTPCEALSTM
jgi:hypothetical protein